MIYTAIQIENAKANYSRFLQYTTAQSDANYSVNPFEAERRAEYSNRIVTDILNGNKELETKWKLFFLTEEVKKDQKENENKAKLNANKEASADILAPIKALKKLGEFGKWLNNSSNQFRKQHFNKVYTTTAVNEFLATL